MRMEYIDIIPNYFDNLSIFLDINTICNLNCSYCCSRSDKEWNKEISISKFETVLLSLKYSTLNLNIILFGGEPLLHPDIELFITKLKNHKKVDNIIILSNGLAKQELYQIPNIYYCLTLHELTATQTKIFQENLLGIKNDKLKINIPLNPKNAKSIIEMNTFIEMNQLSDNRIISLIYNSVTKSVYTKSEVKDFFLEIDLYSIDQKFNYGQEQTLSFMEYFNIHSILNPKLDIVSCGMNEVNIDLKGNVVSDCLEINGNIFKNPFIFKNIKLGKQCQKETCIDCTGGITCPKIIKS